ncbi:hypothetical protein PLESTB_001074900 [Pleodorina starrii]|uniref:J domain-containing protein n=1 Tax=Pleodorina starrii TaxID=330485 RepID=A0A9W6F4Q6_9CHLO|nr:hypothetical protein PLESTM_001184100 [Pleodorina starrii]GLC56159.1 hypothetical protein PLESTB_001074900 [Pleodorina starrii]GLC74956.1 hypothetical protein PLESTF_001576900 [Pleodorina starrii]
MQACFSGRSAPAAARGRSGRSATVFVVCKQYDASVRVKGSVKRVFKYAADFEHLPEWYPGVTSVIRTRGEGINLKNTYTVERTIMKMNHSSQYEVIDVAPGRKVVYSAQSPIHTAVHQLYFMEDPTDRNYTNVRYIKKIQLRSLAGALQPLVAGALSKIPEEGLNNLAKLLISPDTPLSKITLDPEDEEEEIRAAKPAASWSWQSVWDGLGLGSISNGSSAPSSTRGAAVVDTLGYYAILGLDVRRVAQYGPDDIKAAYRARAMEMHPDKVSVDDSAAQQSATLKFQRLQKAYNVLKNPEHKRLYDSGNLVEELVQ